MELEDLIDDTEYEDGLPDIWWANLKINNILNYEYWKNKEYCK